MKLERRRFLQTVASLPIVSYFTGCAPNANAAVRTGQLNNKNENISTGDQQSSSDVQYPPALDILNRSRFKQGYLSIIQGPTSDSEALINIFSPRLKKYGYKVTDPNNVEVKVDFYSQLKGPLFYNIDKIKVSGLKPNQYYKLQVIDSLSSSKTIIDERMFKSLDIQNTKSRFALVSCMADDFRFDEIIDPMWDKLYKQNADFLILTGDLVYVDDKQFVERQKATQYDLWQRYTDCFKRIPLYHWYYLKPVFATWDDHDFGTNDGDRNFIAKDASLEIFKAAFLGQDIYGSDGSTVWSNEKEGTQSQFSAFSQKFVFMDNRSFRQPNNDYKSENYGYWGIRQHKWLIDGLKKDNRPSWIFNGNQFFNGANKEFIESLARNQPAEYKIFLNDLKNTNVPVVFGSGDVHISEIMKIPKNLLGYETYEFTSSSMHSYVGDGWDNPMRVSAAYVKEFNFVVLESSNINGNLLINARSFGLQSQPYFNLNFQVNK